MEKKFSLHIFDFGDIQLNIQNKSLVQKTSDLTKANYVISEILSRKPEGNNATKFRAINIINYREATWIEKDNLFSIKIDDVLKAKIDDLIAEIENLNNATS